MRHFKLRRKRKRVPIAVRKPYWLSRQENGSYWIYGTRRDGQPRLIGRMEDEPIARRVVAMLNGRHQPAEVAA